MIKNLRWKIVTIVVVFVVFSGIGIYPLLAQRFNLPAPAWLMAKRLHLGLDLQGGVHLVLRVQTSDALRIFTTTTSEQLREGLRTAGVGFGSITLASERSFKVEGVAADRDAEFRRIADEHTAEATSAAPV
jgi:preprotein translocase subunit SecD